MTKTEAGKVEKAIRGAGYYADMMRDGSAWVVETEGDNRILWSLTAQDRANLEAGFPQLIGRG